MVLLNFRYVTRRYEYSEFIKIWQGFFGVVRVPYSLKLLYQELQSMNVQMRIITEDNVDQLTTVGYSDNIVKLTKNENITPLKVEENK